MKQAEAQVWEQLQEFWKRGQWVEPIIQIHDDLLLEAEESVAKDVHTMMVRAMTQVPHTISVPLLVEGKYGQNWAYMERFV